MRVGGSGFVYWGSEFRVEVHFLGFRALGVGVESLRLREV